MRTENFTSADLELWAEKELITTQQVTNIYRFVEQHGTALEQDDHNVEVRQGFNLISIAYYFGGFMILLAYTIFMGIQWEDLSEVGRIAVAAITIGALWGIGALLRKMEFTLAGNLLIFAGTGIVPLLVFTIQQTLGLWGEDLIYEDFYRVIAQAWVPLEIISMAVAIIVIWYVRFPLISLLISFWAWFLSMDIIRLITGSDSWSWSTEEQLISTLIGLVLLAVGYTLQRSDKRDYSFWFYLFGHIIVLCHFTALALEDEGILSLLFIIVYLAFVVASVWLQSRLFLVFGALGSYGYLCYLAFRIFDGALGFVIGLAFVGLCIVLSAVGYQKYARPWLEDRFNITAV